MNLSDIEIKIKRTGQSLGTLAYVKVTVPAEIDGHPVRMEISGFRIMTTQFGVQRGSPYNVLPPSILSSKPGKRYKEVVFFDDREIWHKLTAYILSKFGQSISEESRAEDNPF